MSDEILYEIKASQERILDRIEQIEERLLSKLDALEKAVSEHAADTEDSFAESLDALRCN